MAARAGVDPVHPNVAKQKQYQVCSQLFPWLISLDYISGGRLQVPQHRPQYRRVSEQSGIQSQGDPSLQDRSSVPADGNLTAATQGRH